MPAALNSTFLYSHKFWILSSAHAANTRMNTRRSINSSTVRLYLFGCHIGIADMLVHSIVAATRPSIIDKLDS